jgi:endonuclease YncB( thermonuclease family)
MISFLQARLWPAMAVVVVIGLTAPAVRGQTLDGPLPARVLAVIDGDTLVARVRIWLGQSLEVRVRLAGIDAPELRGRCPREAALAVAARDFLIRRTGGGEVSISQVRLGKYAGRVIARVADAKGADLSQALRSAGLARAYRGARRKSWCNETLAEGGLSGSSGSRSDR